MKVLSVFLLLHLCLVCLMVMIDEQTQDRIRIEIDGVLSTVPIRGQSHFSQPDLEMWEKQLVWLLPPLLYRHRSASVRWVSDGTLWFWDLKQSHVLNCRFVK